MGKMCPKRRTAFTLVELLIVIAIIGVLIQLLLPAVQASRERARKAQCQNHLKQIALATQMHVNTHEFFPSGGWSGGYLADPHRGYGRKQPGGWLFSVLEYMEESTLRTAAKSGRLEDFPLGAGLESLYQSAPPVFYCPSRREARPYPFKRGGTGGWIPSVAQGVLLLSSVTKSDYAANSGDALYSAAKSLKVDLELWVPANYDSLKTDPPEWTRTADEDSPFFQAGVVYYRSQVRAAQILDGLSKTYLCGEKFMSPDIYDDVNQSEAIGMEGDNQSAWVGFEWDNHRVAWNPLSRWSPEDYQPQQDAPISGAAGVFAFGSPHPGSLNMAFCDGSVRELSYEVDRDTHRYSANRLDGQSSP